MKNATNGRRKLGSAMLLAVAFCALLLGVEFGRSPTGFPGNPTLGFSATTSQGLPDFVSLAKKLKPVVVNISATRTGARTQEFLGPSEEEGPFNGLFGDLPQGPRSREKSLGSGFIIEPNGTILTNYHVVENAEKIMVKLADGRDLPAKVLGKDPKTDIAVIKIDAKTNLTAAPLGDSDKLEVGEWVMAVGNPFGLDSSVTSGIVSAKGRHIGAGPYDDFLQTDAPVNPGSSGGPLINMRAEVVGINTAIVSQTGGNIGIAFATPINLVKELVPQLKEKGKVTRGSLGVVIQRVTPPMAESLGTNKARGALVAGVAKGGPAHRAGIKMGDVITEFDGKEIKESDELPIMVARTPVNKSVPLKVVRETRELTVAVTIGELKEERGLGQRGGKDPKAESPWG
jgi:serine protease Do